MAQGELGRHGQAAVARAGRDSVGQVGSAQGRPRRHEAGHSGTRQAAAAQGRLGRCRAGRGDAGQAGAVRRA